MAVYQTTSDLNNSGIKLVDLVEACTKRSYKPQSIET